MKKILSSVLVMLFVFTTSTFALDQNETLKKDVVFNSYNINKVIPIVKKYDSKINDLIKKKHYNYYILKIKLWWYEYDMFMNNQLIFKEQLITTINKIKNSPSFKEELKKDWNNNTSYIFNLIKSDKTKGLCGYYDSYLSNINKINWINNILYHNNYQPIIKINIPLLIGCHYDQFFTKQKKSLDAIYKKYRYTNIAAFIDRTFYLKSWETFNVLKHVDEIENKLVDWLAIIKWEITKIRWWWLCGASTILYQWISTIKKWIQITERHSHSEYFRHYYWNIIWMDSTIFTPTLNLKFKNKSDFTLIIDWYTKKINNRKMNYGIIFYRPYLSNDLTYYTMGKIYKKDDKTCVKNYIHDKNTWKVIYTTNSCYKIVG